MLNEHEIADRVKEFISTTITNIPVEVKNKIPPILTVEKILYNIYVSEKYLILSFIDSDEQERIEKLKKRELHPYPGLVAETENDKSAFKLIQAKNTYIERCTVKNQYTLALGKDSTCVLTNHTLEVIIDAEEYNYKIQLAFVVSFGDEINLNNFHEFLDELFYHSLKNWRS